MVMGRIREERGTMCNLGEKKRNKSHVQEWSDISDFIIYIYIKRERERERYIYIYIERESLLTYPNES